MFSDVTPVSEGFQSDRGASRIPAAADVTKWLDGLEVGDAINFPTPTEEHVKYLRKQIERHRRDTGTHWTVSKGKVNGAVVHQVKRVAAAKGAKAAGSATA